MISYLRRLRRMFLLSFFLSFFFNQVTRECNSVFPRAHVLIRDQLEEPAFDPNVATLMFFKRDQQKPRLREREEGRKKSTEKRKADETGTLEETVK